MAHHDHAGASHSTSAAPVVPADEAMEMPEREEELDRARGIQESEDLSISGLDPALRLQDAVGTWLEGNDTTPEEVGHADERDQSEPEPEPFVPLTDSGGQGI